MQNTARSRRTQAAKATPEDRALAERAAQFLADIPADADCLTRLTLTSRAFPGIKLETPLAALVFGRALAAAMSPEHERLARLRELMRDDVSFERAYSELNKQNGAPASTLATAEYLAANGNKEQLGQWLTTHGDEEIEAIQQHFQRKNKQRAR